MPALRMTAVYLPAETGSQARMNVSGDVGSGGDRTAVIRRASGRKGVGIHQQDVAALASSLEPEIALALVELAVERSQQDRSHPLAGRDFAVGHRDQNGFGARLERAAAGDASGDDEEECQFGASGRSKRANHENRFVAGTSRVDLARTMAVLFPDTIF